jgi:hypothetical protein
MNINNDPNARYDHGPNAAGTGRSTYPPQTTVIVETAGTAFTVTAGGPYAIAGTLTGATYLYGTTASTGSFSFDVVSGMAHDTSIQASPLRDGFSCAGNIKNNPGPNVAGAPRTFNNT